MADNIDWKAFVGQEGAVVVSAIKAALPDLKQVVIVPPDSMVTMDIREDRVRVYTDEDGNCSRPPRIG